MTICIWSTVTRTIRSMGMHGIHRSWAIRKYVCSYDHRREIEVYVKTISVVTTFASIVQVV
jgi:hypothetical protein